MNSTKVTTDDTTIRNLVRSAWNGDGRNFGYRALAALIRSKGVADATDTRVRRAMRELGLRGTRGGHRVVPPGQSTESERRLGV